MAGFDEVFFLGGAGGFQGADGVNPVETIILVGNADRQWLEPRYLEGPRCPLAQLKAVIPQAPHHPDLLLDACIAFRPDMFEDCPSLAAVASLLGSVERLDLDQGPRRVREAWNRLREEARGPFRALCLWRARLEAVPR